MGTTTVRVSEHTRQLAAELAEQSGQTIASLVDEAIEHLRRERYWAEVNASLERVRRDPDEWASYRAELTDWEGMLAERMDDE